MFRFRLSQHQENLTQDFFLAGNFLDLRMLDSNVLMRELENKALLRETPITKMIKFVK